MSENKKLSVHTCLRCGKDWVSRQNCRPKRCGVCTSTNWWKLAGESFRGRPIKYPVNDLQKGEKMEFEFADVPNFVSMRQSLIAYGKRHGMKFEIVNKINSFTVERVL